MIFKVKYKQKMKKKKINFCAENHFRFCLPSQFDLNQLFYGKFSISY